MDTKQAYNLWSKQYDSNTNKTRDVEAKALRTTLANYHFDRVLEIGCGTGKNTEWLLQNTNSLTAVDFSEEMIELAMSKIKSDKVKFIRADINKSWDFIEDKFDIVSFSLVLEHIENLDHIFMEASNVLLPGGIVYLGELHPYKQYNGTKARFETEEGLQILECFNHNISDFINSAKRHGLQIAELNEFFDEDNASVPRVLVIVFRKKP
ncbi:MAG TPA: class I SAM-dependent methyltransferase [Ignavibacteriaceae bacterium]